MRIFAGSTIRDLAEVRKDIEQIIVKSEYVPIMAENFIDPGDVSAGR
jgi:hypothetical protein